MALSQMGEPSADRVDGPTGWLVAAVAFFALFAVFGVLYSFGAFFSSMEDEFGAGKGGTALIFAVTTFVLYLVGPWSGKLVDRRGPRVVLLIASVSIGAGLVATSFAPTIWFGYVSYGLGVGVAAGFVYVPMVAVVSRWFVRRRTTALGVAVTGNGFGPVVFAPVAAVLVGSIGWRSSYLLFGLGASVVLAVCAFVMPRDAPTVPPRTADDAPAMRTREFRLLYATSFFMTFSLFTPFVFLQPYAEEQGIGATAAAGLVSLVGAGSIVGRLVLGVFGQRLGAARLLEVAFATLTVSYLVWLTADDSYVLLSVFAVMLGSGLGGFSALMPAVAADLFGVVGLGSVLGLLYTAAGAGGLIGPPMSGVIIDSWSYDAAIIVAMTFGALGTATLHHLRTHDRPNR